MLRLDFTYEDLGLPKMAAVTRRHSISGVQEKTLLSRQGRRFVPVESGGCFGVDGTEVRELIGRLVAARETVEASVRSSALSGEAKTLYLTKFKDRLRALAQ